MSHVNANEALLLVDLQNDFLPGGSLAVPQADEVISIANQLIPRFSNLLATQDWHPAGHESFASSHQGRAIGEVIDLHGLQQILWPDHCIQWTAGAAFSSELNLENVAVFHKGTDPRVDSYSGFFDNGRQHRTNLASHLSSQQIGLLYVMGLATDYCVKFTVLDALELGFRVRLIEDGCRGVNLEAGDAQKAIADMQSAGAEIWSSSQVLDVRR